MRIRTLRPDPGAFASTTVRERVRTRSGWQKKTDLSTWLVANMSGNPVGLVCGSISHDAADERDLTSLWVSSPWRGIGVARRLVEEGIARAY
ncbi:GNAT family N-acetyltransferase [Pseudofrankia asymbiotica]|uniref:N-acetyltransferase domain-containing protein n=1 Tax=Pseudofrankia asymbiotica TaxID=1834516 RepID=A0A1V2IC98_9ACTN|nr:GNAT family N-acetyltransferase [Pseudofrankia asymbiotica]ONH29783.1 hypothetical protein BL253_16235 [Pseudofrankia asymbiotica]